MKKKTLSQIIDETYAKYPSFDTFEFEKYNKYFPTMKQNEMEAKINTMHELMEKMMGYEVAARFKAEGDGNFKLSYKKNGRTNSTVPNLAACEVAYYLLHLRMDQGGIYYSKARSFELSNSKGYNADSTDALRHGVWGTILGKHACYRYGSILEAAGVAQGFINSHECFEWSMDSKMDDHNNEITMLYYLQNARRFRKGFLNWNVSIDKDDWDIRDDIDAKGYVKVDRNNTGIDNAPKDSLIHF